MFGRAMMWSARIATEYAVIALALLSAHVLGAISWLPATLIIGTRLHALGVIGHWAMHGLLPRWQMWVCFVPIAVDPKVYVRTHAWHHGNLGSPSFDPEVKVVMRHAHNWEPPAWEAASADAMWTTLDEAFDVMTMLASKRSIMWYVAILASMLAIIGPISLLLPASVNGLMMAHRMRARYEHDHINSPGITFNHTKPGLLERVAWVPHYAWLHSEHHAKPGEAVWIGR